MRPGEQAAADELLSDRLEVVAEHHDVVAVPADAAADVEQDLRQEHQHRADLVRDRLGRMVVAGIERVEHLARQRVRQIELVRSDRITLAPDAEQLAFDGIEVEGGVERFREHRVERFDQARSGSHAIYRGIFHAVGNPEVRHTRRAERFSHRGPDAAAGRRVADPERPNALVAMRQREVVSGLGM